MTQNELRELDTWIAEHVMKWKCIKWRTTKKAKWFRTLGGEEFLVGEARKPFPYECDHPEKSLFHPTVDPVWTMEVLEKCAIKLVPKRLHIYPPTRGIFKWMVSNCESSNSNPIDAMGDTLPLAICLFAKKLFSV